MSEIVAKLLKDRERRPGQQEDETKGQFFWRILRESIRETSKLVAKADAKDIYIGHGMHHLRRINHVQQIKHVLHIPETEEYITIDSRGFNIFYLDGRWKNHAEPEEPVDKLLYAKHVKRYVGWTVGEQYIKVFTDTFELISEAKSPHKISSIAYNEHQGEIVSTGPGHLISWCFRYGAKHLILRKFTTEGLSSAEHFSMIALEGTASRTQRCFTVCASNVAVFNLFEGAMLSYKKNLHVRDISSILFFNPLKYLVTGARDGSIKVWDDGWDLHLVFVGHRGPVTALAIYPYGPAIMSGAQDCTIRVWSFETYDEVDQIETVEIVEGLGTTLNKDDIHSFSQTTVDLWKLRQIHDLFTAVGSKVDKIKVTDHPDVPARAMCVSRNGTVRILTPGSGDVLTSYIAESGKQVLDAAYAAKKDTLFVILNSGEVIKIDTTTNPCRMLHSHNQKLTSEKHGLSCICLYEYVVESSLQTDTWKGLLKSVSASKASTARDLKAKDRTLLIGGRNDGHVVVLDWKTLKTVFTTDAHGFKGILGLVANPKHDQLITAGMDNVLKIWRVFPFADECLAPLMSIYCAHTPLHMSVMRNTLCVAFQDPSSVTYSLVHYNLKTKSRNDHSPDDDHIDNITGLACNPRMRYFASSSTDGTIKIWDEDNKLIRAIKLNADPLSLNFCSQRGDLLVGIGNHIHRIDHRRYLPRPFLRKMVSMVFPEIPTEEVIPITQETARMLSPLGHKRLMAAHSSVFKYDTFEDVLTPEEEEEISKEAKIKEEAFKILAAREDELQRLRDGEVKPSRHYNAKVRETSAASKAKTAGFKKYWRLMHLETKRPNIPDEDDFNPDGSEEEDDEEAPWIPDVEPSGFFPAISTAKRPRAKRKHKFQERMDTHEESGPPIHPSGFIPNSVLVRLLWPEERIVEKRSTPYRPPQLTESQLAEIATRKKIGRKTAQVTTQMDHNSVDKHNESLYGKRKRSQKDVEVADLPDDKRSGCLLFIRPGEDFISRHRRIDRKVTNPLQLRRVPMKVFTQPMTLENEPSEISFDMGGTPKSSLAEKFNIDINQSATPRQTTPPPSSPEPEKVEEEPKPEVQEEGPPEEPKAKPDVLVEEKVPTPEIKSPTPPPRPPSPPRPPTPLPAFISQFIGSDWFDEYFPNASSRNFPKPWTVTAFVTMLLRLIKIADYGMKTPIIYALLNLHNQDSLSNAQTVLDTLLSILMKPSGPSCQDEDQKEFIIASLHVIRGFGIFSMEVTVELMVLFLEGDKDVRELVFDVLLHIGLQDIHGYFTKELDGWDIWNLPEETRRSDIGNMAKKWMEKWLMHFKNHLRRTIEQLKRGRLAGNIQRAQAKIASPADSGTPKGILRKLDQGSEASTPFSQDQASESGLSETTEGSRVKFTETPASENKQVTVTFDVAPDATSIENAQPIEAINYFVEMQHERYLEKLALAQAREDAAKLQPVKNTVVVLPKIQRESFDEDLESRFSRELMFDDAKRKKKKRTSDSKPSLVRLGETHTSQCRPKRETALNVDFKLPPIQHTSQLPDVDGLYKFTTKIDLPLKIYNVNPFPGPIDLYDQLHQPILLTLKSSQKYFIPNQSVVNHENFR